MNTAESTVVCTLDLETQQRLMTQVSAIKKASPFVRPVAVGGLPMSVRITSAGTWGWVADGGYRYTKTDARGRPWPAMPDEWREIANGALLLDPRCACHGCAGKGCFDQGGGATTMCRQCDGLSLNPAARNVRWDSAIINWYDPGAHLGWHVDKSEVDRSRPIVTISLGDPATWGVEVETHGHDEQGRATVAFERSRARLVSGAVTVLAGPLRGASHTIERILVREMFDPPSPITDKDGAYVPGRVSITIRQAGP
jgi:alkylated DNA repair protein (DNA oxidative demethylase)